MNLIFSKIGKVLVRYLVKSNSGITSSAFSEIDSSKVSANFLHNSLFILKSNYFKSSIFFFLRYSKNLSKPIDPIGPFINLFFEQ